MGNIFLRFLLSYSNACTISIMDMIVVPSELLVAKIKWIILHLNYYILNLLSIGISFISESDDSVLHKYGCLNMTELLPWENGTSIL